jgi:hypothetical protein
LGVQVIEQQRHGHRAKALGRDADNQAVLIEIGAGNRHGSRVPKKECGRLWAASQGGGKEPRQC